MRRRGPHRVACGADVASWCARLQRLCAGYPALTRRVVLDGHGGGYRDQFAGVGAGDSDVRGAGVVAG
ncbi:hypothetical protein GCM10027575_16560 [Phytohabitans suffuscus]